MKMKKSNRKDYQQAILNRIANGDKIGSYPTGDEKGYSDYLRMVSDKCTVPSKTYFAMKAKNLIPAGAYIGMQTEIIKPADAPSYINL